MAQGWGQGWVNNKVKVKVKVKDKVKVKVKVEVEVKVFASENIILLGWLWSLGQSYRLSLSWLVT